MERSRDLADGVPARAGERALLAAPPARTVRRGYGEGFGAYTVPTDHRGAMTTPSGEVVAEV